MSRFPGRPPRLPSDRYTGEYTVAFTVCLRERRPYFLTEDLVGPHVDCLRRACEKGRCFTPIYCFMPDHLHLMFKGLGADSNMLDAMRHFKLTSGILLARQGPARWQESFHDHVMRAGQDWRRHAHYIAMNPVRAGLVESPFSYPFSGTIGCDLQDIVLRMD